MPGEAAGIAFRWCVRNAASGYRGTGSVVLTHARQVAQGEAPKAFYFDRTSPATVAMAEWAKQNGSVVLFEPSSISEDALFERAVDACHILKFSNERFGRDLELSEARGPLLVVRTMGANGLQARWKGRWSFLSRLSRPGLLTRRVPGTRCSVGLLHVLAQKGVHKFVTARKTDVESALRLGQALAALSCGFEGARGLMSAISTVERVNRMLRDMVGGGGIFEDVALATARMTEVEVCKLCSDARQTMATAKKAKQA